MATLLVIIALIAGAAGLLFLSEATTGVGIIGLACLFGIFARIAQAGDQHKKQMERLTELHNKQVSAMAKFEGATTEDAGAVADAS